MQTQRKIKDEVEQGIYLFLVGWLEIRVPKMAKVAYHGTWQQEEKKRGGGSLGKQGGEVNFQDTGRRGCDLEE